MKQDMIVILDMGSTENTVVARQIRALGVYSEIHPHDITPQELAALDNVKGIILNGGENRVVDGTPVEVSDELYTLGYPMMAIADAGAIMPPKSTWFEPKLRSGLFVHTV